MAQGVREAQKSQNLWSACQRIRKASGVIQSESEGLRITEANGVKSRSKGLRIRELVV